MIRGRIGGRGRRRRERGGVHKFPGFGKGGLRRDLEDCEGLNLALLVRGRNELLFKEFACRASVSQASKIIT